MSLSLSPSLLSISFSISLSAPSPNGVGPCWLPVWGGGEGGISESVWLLTGPATGGEQRSHVPLPRSIWKDDHASRYHALYERTSRYHALYEKTTTRPATTLFTEGRLRVPLYHALHERTLGGGRVLVLRSTQKYSRVSLKTESGYSIVISATKTLVLQMVLWQRVLGLFKRVQ